MPTVLLRAIQTALDNDDPLERWRLCVAAAAGFRQRMALEELAGAIGAARGADAIAEKLGATPGDVAARIVSLTEDDEDRVEALIEEPEI